MSDMKMLNERGAMNTLLVPLILLIVLLAGAAGFGMWAYMSRQDFKDNSEQKSAVAAAKAVEETKAADAVQYAEAAKQPYDTFTGSPAFGTIRLKYPKTWSAYIIQTESDSQPIRGYLHPGIVPDASNQNNAFALRMELTQTSYDQALRQYTNLVENKKVTIAPATLPKVPGVVGSRIEGQITNTKQGSMIIFPIRNMALKVWTESPDFKADFDTHVLPNLEFIP